MPVTGADFDQVSQAFNVDCMAYAQVLVCVTLCVCNATRLLTAALGIQVGSVAKDSRGARCCAGFES